MENNQVNNTGLPVMPAVPQQPVAKPMPAAPAQAAPQPVQAAPQSAPQAPVAPTTQAAQPFQPVVQAAPVEPQVVAQPATQPVQAPVVEPVAPAPVQPAPVEQPNQLVVPVLEPTAVPEPPATSAPSTNASPTNAFGPSLTGSEKEVRPLKEEPKHISNKNNGLFNVDELLKEYIGPNYDKFLMRPFNFAAFFFTAIYFFYRKMTLYGIILIIIQSVMSYFLISMPYALLIVNVLCGFLTNKIYAHFALRKINKIIMNHGGRSTEYIKGVCSVAGGRSIQRIFTSLVLLMLLLLPVGVVLALFNFSTDFRNYIENFDLSKISFEKVKLPEIELENKFDGYIMVDKKYEVLDMFVVRTPNVFKPTSNNNKYELEYAYKSSKKAKSTCTYSFKAISGYSNAKNLINDMHEYYKDKNPTNVREDMINRIFWNGFNYHTDDANIYYYTCSRGTTVYLFVFVDEINTTSSCLNYMSEILNDIVYK